MGGYQNVTRGIFTSRSNPIWLLATPAVVIACTATRPLPEKGGHNARVAHSAAAADSRSATAKTTRPSDDLLADLIFELEPVESLGRALQTPAQVLDTCPHPEKRWAEDKPCMLVSSAVYDPNERAWVVLSVTWGEIYAEHLSLDIVRPGSTSTLFAGEVSHRSVGEARRRLRPHESLPALEDLRSEQTLETFSLANYSRLVALGAPLEGWLLYLDVTDQVPADLGLHLLRRDRSTHHRLGTRAAGAVPCDGDYACKADPQKPCTMKEIEAEGRACPRPAAIDAVLLAPDRSSLLVLGTMAPGHAGAPAFHWAVALDHVEPPPL